MFFFFDILKIKDLKTELITDVRFLFKSYLFNYLNL